MKIVDEKIPEKEYKNILEKMPICCVDLVIVREGKVLLIKRKGDSFDGKWFIIGGRIYKNEKLEDAVKRKAFEETGLNVKILKNLGIFEAFEDSSAFGNSIKSGTHSISGGFLVEPIEEVEVKLDETSTDFKWVDRIDENLAEYPKRLIKASGVFD